MPKLPMEGIRVVDLTAVWAGPFATQMLADWGAEVIWVESRQILSRGYRGERGVVHVKGRLANAPPNRELGKRPWNRNPIVNLHSRNKLSMTVNLRTPEGFDILKRLIKVSDVFIENNGPGTMEKLGITYDVLKEVKPDIIMVRMPGFGLTGPYKNFRSFGSQKVGYRQQVVKLPTPISRTGLKYSPRWKASQGVERTAVLWEKYGTNLEKVS